MRSVQLDACIHSHANDSEHLILCLRITSFRGGAPLDLVPRVREKMAGILGEGSARAPIEEQEMRTIAVRMLAS